MPWLLQQKFPNYNVINLAQNGYGNTQSVIQYQMIEKNLRDDDILILAYGDYFLVRNYGTPSWIKSIIVPQTGPGVLVEQDIDKQLTGPGVLGEVRYAVARIAANGVLTIDYIKLNCAENAGYCDEKEPANSLMVESTKSILNFFSKVKKKVMLAFISGDDDDPVIKYAREIGLPIADIRLDKSQPEWNDFYPFDGHPAQIAQYNYFRKLSAALIDQNIVSGLPH
jgi:hypothetical protein